MKLVHSLSALSLALLAPACTTTQASRCDADAAAQFEALKVLEGRWESRPGSADPKEAITYRLTSGGSVLMEDLFPGTPHEMITMYHLDHGELMLTHYCSAGNQPAMRMQDPASDGTLTFRCAGGTNMDCAKDGHMHQAVIRVVDKNHMKSAWTFFNEGKPAETKEFDLVRVPGG